MRILCWGAGANSQALRTSSGRWAPVEFGGPIGTGFIIVGKWMEYRGQCGRVAMTLTRKGGSRFGTTVDSLPTVSHVLLYYVWWVVNLNGGELTPVPGSNWQSAWNDLVEKTTPTEAAARLYFCFLAVQFFFAFVMPGIDIKGRADENGVRGESAACRLAAVMRPTATPLFASTDRAHVSLQRPPLLVGIPRSARARDDRAAERGARRRVVTRGGGPVAAARVFAGAVGGAVRAHHDRLGALGRRALRLPHRQRLPNEE